MRIEELAFARPLLAPLLQPFSVAVEERDSAVHVAVRHIKGSVGTDCNVGRFIEMGRIPSSNAWFPNREDKLAVVGEFKNLLQGDVSKENVVLPVNGDAVRHHKRV